MYNTHITRFVWSGCTRYTRHYLTLLNKVTPKGAIIYKIVAVTDVMCLSERFDMDLADMWNPLVTQLGRHLHWPNVETSPLKQGDQDRHLSWLSTKGGHFDTLNRAHLALLDYPTGFFRAFLLSCKANDRVQHVKTEHGPHCSHVRRLNFTTI